MTIICISGTPATGKTTVSKALGELLGWKVIEINKLAEEKNLYAGYDQKRKAKIVDIDMIQKEIRKMKMKNIILESHYAHELECDLVIILRANPQELRKRMRKKGWKKDKIEENVVSEIMEICMTEAMELGRKVITIDTTGKDPKQIAEEIAKQIQSK